MGNCALLLPPPSREAEEGEQGAGGAWTGGVVERGGGQGVGEKGEEEEGVRLPYLARAGVERGSLATKTDGGGRRCAWRRRCRAGEGADGGGGACGDGERRGGALL